jgi:uncharacterized protein YbaR (Trm112 family)
VTASGDSPTGPRPGVASCLAPGDPSLLDKDLLDILACPACRADVRLEGDRIVCAGCGRRYPVRDGIPIMLVEEAEGTAPAAEPKR